MFGLSDNNDNNNYSDTTQMSASGAPQEETRQPLSAGGPLPPATDQNKDYASSQPGATSLVLRQQKVIRRPLRLLRGWGTLT
jgi:hypothetical protein